ncbi:hypothetical protein ALNOE001_07240 [Candidatus Methanobinarius endosymbioticus]|uniref:Uncharacterized protein n=1 Tax=Candidatus Methanobinarius endosymbioticus TaxID=2006182 RepID=A0A366MDU1_9EURY|nr:hypothetical protein ALNOE001_07240 [Candidatus Methanobinarius endosymbioticus]
MDKVSKSYEKKFNTVTYMQISIEDPITWYVNPMTNDIIYSLINLMRDGDVLFFGDGAYYGLSLNIDKSIYITGNVGNVLLVGNSSIDGIIVNIGNVNINNLNLSSYRTEINLNSYD